MGYELWASSLTGYRRKGTRFTDIKQIFIDNVTAKCIYEPLLSCPVNSVSIEAKEELEKRDFDIAGVKKAKGGVVIGYVVADEIGNDDFNKYIKKIGHELLISDSTPLAELFSILSAKNFVLVVYANNIVGIITRADINKPPVRIYIFGMISLLEMHFNSWIRYFYPRDSWIEKVKADRLKDAKENYEDRRGNNQDLTLLECLQICDKRDLLKDISEFIRLFNFTKSKFVNFAERIEKIRNEIAHSQNSIISNMDWNEFIETIASMEQFLISSDMEIERIAKGGIDFQSLLI